MKILLVCMEYDYGDINRGHSYEYFNFYQSLVTDGYEVEIFDYMQELAKSTKEEMNLALVEKTRKFSPDIAIFSLYTDQLFPETIHSVRELTQTLCFFHDDTWRKDFSLYWAKQFDYFSSPDIYCVEKYRRLGLNNVIHFPFGVNHHLYKKLSRIEKIYDLSFVGGWHPVREWLIKLIEKNGFKVYVAGHGWPNGIINHNRMIEIFNQTKINLNFSNSSNWDARYLFHRPKSLKDNIKGAKNVEQMKARMFEINSCGSFQLCYYVDGLEHSYKITKEIGVYISPNDLIEKINFYLGSDLYREEIAEAGQLRTLKDHTYSHRFDLIFKQMGLAK